MPYIHIVAVLTMPVHVTNEFDNTFMGTAVAFNQEELQRCL